MVNFATTWKPVITHLTDWDATGEPRTLCGIRIESDWGSGDDTMPEGYLAEGIACGCRKCQKIAMARVGGAT